MSKKQLVTSCPECGSIEYVNKNLVGEGYRCCRNCHQDWWINVEYDEPLPTPRIDSANNHIHDLIDEITKLKNQESTGMDATIDQMLSKDIAVKWGLDEHGHKRNVQHIFMRCCQAIDDLEAQTRWIPVEEELPKETKKDLRPQVLVFDGESISVALWRHYDCGWDFETDRGKPTHWLLINKPEGE